MPYLGILNDKQCVDEIEHGIWQRRDVLMNTETTKSQDTQHLLCLIFTVAVVAEKTKTSIKREREKRNK